MDRLNQISIFPIIDADAKSPAVWESKYSSDKNVISIYKQARW